MRKKQVIGLMFTYPLSLEEWVKSGLFDREKALYEEHIKKKHVDKVIWFSFGIHDEQLRNELAEEGKLDPAIEVIGAPKWANLRFFRWVYAKMLPVICDNACKELCLIKSNQTGGADIALRIAKRYRIPFYYRTGYTYSIFLKKKNISEKNVLKRIKKRFWYIWWSGKERELYSKCDIAVVSSSEDRQYICDTYHVSGDKVKLLTNYIDCERFRLQTPITARKNRFLFVGRLSEQKNLNNLIQAFEEIKLGLDIYGGGEKRQELERLLEASTADVRLLGKVSNAELPAIYNSYKYFILPSFYEGMPKTLLEAMACGCVCFGTDVNGIREVIQDRVNGFLIDKTEYSCIADKVLKSVETGDNGISKSASEYIKNKHSLEIICDNENEIFTYMTKERQNVRECRRN